MARTLVYKRALDAVLADTHASTMHDVQVQDGRKIKEEPIDETLSTGTSKDYIMKKCCTRSHEETLCNSSLRVNISNKENESVSNNCPVPLEDVKKSYNLKRKGAATKRKQIGDNLSVPKKKRKQSIEMFSKNKNVLRKSVIRNLRKKGERKCVIHLKRKTRKQKFSCDICFREFSSLSNYFLHKQYFDFIGNYKCSICKKHCATREKLQAHLAGHRKNMRSSHVLYCNFCDRKYKEKLLLQSHLFHAHGELICSKNTTKSDNLRMANLTSGNTSYENDVLSLEQEESVNSDNNAIRTEKSNIPLINNAKKDLYEEMLKTEESMVEKSSNNELSPTKQLRQPTLAEYLALRKKKCDIKPTPNKLDTLKDHPPTFASHHNEKIENVKLNFSKESNKQLSSPVRRSSDSSEEIEICLSKKPFVKLHADVEMMKSFLERLPTIKHEENEDTNDILRYDREVPYSLRSLRTTSSSKTNINLRRRQTRSISKQSQFTAECRTRSKQMVTNSNKVDSSFEKFTIARLKCKECKIPLRRCDDNTRNDKVSTVDIPFKKNASLNAQCDPVPQDGNNGRNKKLKELEISIERLSPVPVVDPIVKAETVSNVEEETGFLCKVCKKSFPSKSAKREHIKSFHVAYMSSICNARYSVKHQLLQHYLREHRSKHNQCCVCFALFSDYIELQRHLCIHCLKYVQKENDQYPIDIEVKCRSSKKKYKCLQCYKVFPSQSILEMHQSCCIVIPNERGDEKDMDSLPKILCKLSPNKNDEEIMVRQDDKISPTDLVKGPSECSSNNSEETRNKHQTSSSSSSSSSSSVKEELKISEDNRKSSVNDNSSIVKEMGTANKLQDSKESSENDNSANPDQDTRTQLGATDSKATVYPCDTCGKQFQNQRNLQQHIRTFSNSTDVCPICGTAFSSKRLLQSHITAAHVPQISNSYSFHCVFCNQGFVKKCKLRPHVLHLHNQQMLSILASDSFVVQEKSDTSASYTTICNVCNLVFETQDRYIEHRMYYYKNHTFTCSLCTQNFQGMYMFHHHNKLVHYSEDKRKSYSYICEICNEGFNHESHFHSHTMHVHLNEETLADAAKEPEGESQVNSIPEEMLREQILQNKIINLFAKDQKDFKQLSNEYTCHICQIKCSNLDDMIKHIALYSDDGDFKCDKCNRRCETLDILSHHKQLTHHYDGHCNGHLCENCGEIVDTIISLDCHKKHFHPNTNVYDNAKYNNYDQTSSSNTTCTQRQNDSTNSLGTVQYEYKKYRCLFCNLRFTSIDIARSHITKTHINDILSNQVTSQILPTIHNVGIQEKPIPQQIETYQTPSSNNNQTQQFSSVVRTVLPNKEKEYEITIKSSDPLRVVPTSSNIEQGILTPVTLKESDTIPTSTVPTLSKESNVNPSVPVCTESSYSHQTNNGVLSKSGLANKSTIPANSSVKIYKTLIAVPTSPLANPKSTLGTTNWRSVQKDNYTCPLCPLEYPSLIFFHAHMRYAHADSIRPDMRSPQLNQSDQEISIIGCLLCLHRFTDESTYKHHLRNRHAHYVYIQNPEEIRKTAYDISYPATTEKDNNKSSTNCEIITIDDDDDDNIKNTSDQHTPQVVSAAATSEKIGKLKVKSFAKIANLSTDHALKDP
ncbi:hypothetical protein DMN91_010709 [Ooceraea biroi]|uniref:PR domain zinc finger protein n=1 Tax=Ooceraea biroi TaxID=2015173 RepID=A0A026WW31_OOCBI|nr:uncharacterized protein LOC105288187 [Ooceraea biroi]EZA60222.1 PR domain zinc finger protein [Ooceraea biroi]RLU16641.1 hypothetical protein DMN91_010709 [Ooceraea biroi]